MTVATTTISRRRLPVAVPVAIGLAWAAAIAAHLTGLGERYHHGALVGAGAVPGLAALVGFGVIWTVMVAAMMLPSAVPLMRLVASATASVPRPRRVLMLFVGGYLAVWGLFGFLALVFDSGVHRTVDAVPWLEANTWVVASATLALAGAFQLSGLRDRCLTVCRHPGAYLLAHYRRGEMAAARLGWGHGLFCLGCCWALMLVMFAAGVSDLRWMAALGALMAYEKIGRHGEGVARIAGVVALVLAVAVALHPGWAPAILAPDTD